MIAIVIIAINMALLTELSDSGDTGKFMINRTGCCCWPGCSVKVRCQQQADEGEDGRFHGRDEGVARVDVAVAPPIFESLRG
ncbi:MAG: hypothetical protein WCQ21_13430 [Verrucomicrobiota bacterium]